MLTCCMFAYMRVDILHAGILHVDILHAGILHVCIDILHADMLHVCIDILHAGILQKGMASCKNISKVLYITYIVGVGEHRT